MRAAGPSGSGVSADRVRRVALIVGVPGVPIALTALLVCTVLVLFGLGSGAVLGARDSLSVALSAGVPDTDLAVFRAVGARVGVPWQLLAALADAEGNGTAADEQFTGPFRIATEGVTAEQAGSLPESADIIARTLRAALADREIAVSADMLTMSAIQPTSGGFDTAGTRSAATDPAAARGDGGRRRADRPAGGIPTVPSSS